jgi:uncharacterized protein YfaT (DUF1175 family)
VFFREETRGRVPRVRALVTLVAVLVVAGSALVPRSTEIVTDRATLRADGHSTARVKGVQHSWLGNVTPLGRPRVVVDEGRARALGVALLIDHRGDLIVRAGVQPGSLTFTDDKSDSVVHVRFEPDPRDLDRDGLPDAAELLSHDDRRAFTSWFTAIAEMQATAIDDDWAPVHQDCAGLVRYAAKEALRAHDDTWRNTRRSRLLTRAPDISIAHYPKRPLIADKLWRVRAGAFDPDAPVDDQLSASANARTLLHHNVALVSRDVGDARAGDLLFFHVPDAVGSRMHTMIALAARAGGTVDDQATRVVYHTGGEGERGEVRMVTLAALAAHPDAGWRPLVDNPRFIGVHRLHHITHTVEGLSFSSSNDALALEWARAPEAP